MSRFPWRLVLHIPAALFIMIALSISATASGNSVASICDAAARVASRESGVPLKVLRAIALTETGRKSNGKFLPWPWTVNMEGVGNWFESVNAARAYVDGHFRRGARSFDVGCFQINYKWHGHEFDSIDEMFDPTTNARYAARFLNELYTEFGDWSLAAGAYHSRTPKYAKRYSARFDNIWSNLSDLPNITIPLVVQSPAEVVAAVPSRTNRYPFFVKTNQTHGASLVPQGGTETAFISSLSSRPLLEE